MKVEKLAIADVLLLTPQQFSDSRGVFVETWRTVFYIRAEAAQAIARYIDGFYNPVRRHSALDYISPPQFEQTVSP